MRGSARLALRWLCDNEALFDVHRRSDPVLQLQLLKPFSELVLALSALRQLAKPYPRRARDIMHASWTSMECGREPMRLLLTRPDLVEIAGLIASFARCGYRSPSVEHGLSALIGELTGWGADLPMWRRMAVWHALDVLEIQAFPASLPKGALLRDLPLPWTITEGLAYAATHEILYVTDFGLQLHRLPRAAQAYLAFSMPLWIDIFIDRRHWDLLAELLLCAACIGIVVPLYAACILEEQQAVDGSFPGPKGAGREIPARGVREQYFKKRYHTTLVAMLALAAQQPHAPDQFQRVPPASAGR